MKKTIGVTRGLAVAISCPTVSDCKNTTLFSIHKFFLNFFDKAGARVFYVGIDHSHHASRKAAYQYEIFLILPHVRTLGNIRSIKNHILVRLLEGLVKVGNSTEFISGIEQILFLDIAHTAFVSIGGGDDIQSSDKVTLVDESV